MTFIYWLFLGYNLLFDRNPFPSITDHIDMSSVYWATVYGTNFPYSKTISNISLLHGALLMPYPRAKIKGKYHQKHLDLLDGRMYLLLLDIQQIG